MRIGVFGTGQVGRTLAHKLNELGHDVTIGTRDPDATIARGDPDSRGNPPFSAWLEAHPDVELMSFSEAAAGAELIVNATSGAGSLAALETTGEDDLEGKVQGSSM